MMTTATRMLTPPEVAKRWGVAADKVLALIHSGQLKASHLAVDPKGRPRFRIHLAEVERFEDLRSSKPPTLKTRRRRRMAAIGKEWF